MYDVAVIGAGPAGSYLAYKLAEKGHSTIVLEQKERLGEKFCCTGIIGQECIASFNIEDTVILRRFNSARFFSPAGKCLRLQRRETQACIVDRRKFDVALAERAMSQAVTYVLNSPVRDIEIEDNRVRVKAFCRGEERNAEARVAVIASGFSSGLVRRLGLGRIADFVGGAQVEVETEGLDEIEVYFGQDIAPGFFAWLVPASPNRALLGLLSRHNPSHYLKRLLSSLLAQGKISSAEAELRYGTVPLRPLPKTYGNRLIVIGDAAGQVKPTTGGGVYYGLLCADIAANTLHQALEADTLSAGNLAGYERKWKKRLGRELRIGYWGRKLYEHLSDGQIERIFDIIQSNGIVEALLKSEDLSFDGHGEAVLRLVGNTAVSKILGRMRLPWRLTIG